MKWKPIKTAPMDGTSMLCYENGLVYVGSYDLWFKCGRSKLGPPSKHYKWVVKLGKEWLYRGDNCYEPEYIDLNPTHWQPLPNPPAPHKSKEAQRSLTVIETKLDKPTL